MTRDEVQELNRRAEEARYESEMKLASRISSEIWSQVASRDHMTEGPIDAHWAIAIGRAMGLPEVSERWCADPGLSGRHGLMAVDKNTLWHVSSGPLRSMLNRVVPNGTTHLRFSTGPSGDPSVKWFALADFGAGESVAHLVEQLDREVAAWVAKKSEAISARVAEEHRLLGCCATG